MVDVNVAFVVCSNLYSAASLSVHQPSTTGCVAREKYPLPEPTRLAQLKNYFIFCTNNRRHFETLKAKKSDSTQSMLMKK
jgi:hypothetical protein